MMIGTNASKEVVLKTFKKARKRVPEKVKMKRAFFGDLFEKSMSFVCLSVCQCVCHSLRFYFAGGNICALRNVFMYVFFSVICSETRLIEYWVYILIYE